MILRSEMADGFNPTSPQLQVNSLINRRLKLPPIGTNYVEQSGRPSHGDSDLSASQELSLPRIEFKSSGLDRSRVVTESKMTISKGFDDPFSFSRVYTVLPPIGEQVVPSAPLGQRRTDLMIPNAPTSARRHKHSPRKPRVKKQIKTERENASNSENVVDNAIKTADSEETNKFPINTTDPHEVEINQVECNVSNEKPSAVTSSESEKRNSLQFDTICTTFNVSKTVDSYSDSESRTPSPFPQFSTIPDNLRLYADVYPPSPPPSERRARNMIEKTRQLLEEENSFRLSFMEDVSNCRRNATCAELDDALKNAVQLLRDMFLRKTMEELCMIW